MESPDSEKPPRGLAVCFGNTRQSAVREDWIENSSVGPGARYEREQGKGHVIDKGREMIRLKEQNVKPYFCENQVTDIFWRRQGKNFSDALSIDGSYDIAAAKNSRSVASLCLSKDCDF